jgi:hypothetical protein
MTFICVYIYIQYIYVKLATGPTWGQHSHGSLSSPSSRVPLRLEMDLPMILHAKEHMKG